MRFDPAAIDPLLASCGVMVTNILPIGAVCRFVCFVGPATAASGGIDEATALLARKGYTWSFYWQNASARRDGFGVCHFDLSVP